MALLNILTQQLDTGAAIPQPREVVGRDYRSFVDGEGRRRASMLQGPIQLFLQVLAQQDLEVTQRRVRVDPALQRAIRIAKLRQKSLDSLELRQFVSLFGIIEFDLSFLRADKHLGPRLLR